MVAKLRGLGQLLATLRGRTTVFSTFIVAVMILIASTVLVTLFRASLIENLDVLTQAEAKRVALLAQSASISNITDSPRTLYQVVDDTGSIVAASPGLDDADLFSLFRPKGDSPESRTIESIRVGDDPGARVTVLGVDPSPTSKAMTIYVVSTLEPVEESIESLQGVLVIGSPVLLVLFGLISWIVVGRTLKPVDAIRATVDDITDRSLEKRVPVPGPEDEVRRLALTMNRMLERLQSSYERQLRFVADASHELQTPLAAARADLEIALRNPDQSDWQRLAKDLLAINSRMESLVRDLLYLARMDSGSERAPLLRLNLDDVVLEELATMRNNGSEVTLDTSRVSGAEVRGRRRELQRVVRNLLDNACAHANGRIDIELHDDEELVTFIVADDGPGIPPEHRHKIFDRFRKLDEARDPDPGGAGLGLAIVREIVESHGGAVFAEDVLSGARLVVQLPSTSVAQGSTFSDTADGRGRN